jgi:oligo-1,6-glucosidase
VNENFATINAQSQRATAGSVFEFYRALIRLRHDEPVVAHGDFRMLVPEHPALFAYTRTAGRTQLLVEANFGDDPLEVAHVAELDLAPWRGAELLLANYPPDEVDALLFPWEVRVFRRDV